MSPLISVGSGCSGSKRGRLASAFPKARGSLPGLPLAAGRIGHDRVLFV